MNNEITKIMIYDHRKISAIKEEFNTVFPYLKIEFFLKPNTTPSTSTIKFLKNDNITLGECRNGYLNGEIIITPDMTVAALDTTFRDRYGLGVLVFRKSGKAWLETTLTQSWSLEVQNIQGEELSK